MRNEAGFSPENRPQIEFPMPKDAFETFNGDWNRIMKSDMDHSRKSVEITNMYTEARMNLLALYNGIEMLNNAEGSKE